MKLTVNFGSNAKQKTSSFHPTLKGKRLAEPGENCESLISPIYRIYGEFKGPKYPKMETV